MQYNYFLLDCWWRGVGGSVYHVTQDEFSSVPMDEPEGYYYYYFQRFRRTFSKTSQCCHMFSFQEGINTGRSNARMYPRSKKASRAQLARSRVRLMRSDSVETPQEVKPTKKSSSSLRSKLSGAARWFSRKFKRKMFRMTCK